jgi:hypothetical protein
LEWSTASEYNSKQFELEKSFDGVSFRKIATLAAAGNSNSLRFYSYDDPELPVEMNYYRLRSVDVDEKSKLSETILVKNPNAVFDLYVLNNPFHDNITIRFIKMPLGNVTIKLRDMSGRLVSDIQLGKLSQSQITVSLDSKNLSRGTYILQVFSNESVLTKKLIRQ